MFGIGMNEILLLTVLALVIIGPKRLPEVARGLGKIMAEFKRTTNDLRSAVNEEIHSQPGLRELQEIRDEVVGNVRRVQDSARDYIDREMAEEKEIAGSVKDEMRGLAEGMTRTVHEAAEETEEEAAALTGTAPPAAEADAESEATAAAPDAAEPSAGGEGDDEVATVESAASESTAAEPSAADEVATVESAASESTAAESRMAEPSEGDEDEAEKLPTDPAAVLGKNFSAEGFNRYMATHEVVPPPPERQRQVQNLFKHGNLHLNDEPEQEGGAVGEAEAAPDAGAEGAHADDSPEDAAVEEIDARLATRSAADGAATDDGSPPVNRGGDSAAAAEGDAVAGSDAGKTGPRSASGDDG